MRKRNLFETGLTFSIALLTTLVIAQYLYAATTTGGVNWIDPLKYTKPAFYPVTVPDEASCSNKYYVDQQNGSGSACTEDSPCNWSGLLGKPGTTGGPAYIYLKGNARLNLTGTLYGSSGKEIVIKPWPGNNNIVKMTSAADSNVSDANIIKGSKVHHIIIDGGPNLLFEFVGRTNAGNQNAYTLNISSSYITVARSRIHAGSAAGPALGIATGSGTYIDHVWWINNEMYDSTRYYGVYTGGGTGCSSGDTGHEYVYFYNNIFRDICGRGIQIEPRDYGKYTYIEGNAFHNIGDGCSAVPSPSACVQPAEACSGSIDTVVTRNNIMFDLGGGGVHYNGSISNGVTENNTIYDYAKSNYTPQVTSHGLSCYPSGSMTAKNNIILRANKSGIVSFDRCSFTSSTNICEDGNCGNSQISASVSSTFLSSDSNNLDFLKVDQDSPAYSNGVNLYSNGVKSDYLGDLRLSSGEFTIGAIDGNLENPTTASNTISNPRNIRID